MLVVSWLSHELLQQTGAQESDSGWLPSRVLEGEFNTTRDISLIAPYKIYFDQTTHFSPPQFLSVSLCLNSQWRCSQCQQKQVQINGIRKCFQTCHLWPNHREEHWAKAKSTWTSGSLWRGHFVIAGRITMSIHFILRYQCHWVKSIEGK